MTTAINIIEQDVTTTVSEDVVTVALASETKVTVSPTTPGPQGPPGTGGGGSGATEKEYTQANTFTVTDPVYWNGTAWADADSADATTLAQGIVTEASSTKFKVAIGGFYESVGHGLTQDEYHYVAEGGGLTTTEPAISHPILYVVDADNFIIFPYRPSDLAYINKMDNTDETYSGFSEGEVIHALSGGGTATINYLAANSGGNTHLISEDTGGALTITLGADWPAAHDAVTLKIDPTNLTGITWPDPNPFVNVGAGLDYEACVAHDAGTAQFIIRIEKIGGELFYFESSIL